MRHYKVIYYNIIILALFSLIFSPTVSTYAQNPTPQKVIASYSGPWAADMDGSLEILKRCYSEFDKKLIFRLEVWNVGSAGGEQYASASLTIGSYHLFSNSDFTECRFEEYEEDTYTGTFTGGPNGTATVGITDAVLNIQFVDGKKAVTTLEHWGTYELTVENPEAFGAQITSEYIYNKYGIIVEDSFGDDLWEPASWTDQELILLDDVLRELPPELIKKMAVKRIVRNKQNFDKNGFPQSSTAGLYSACNGKEWKNCDGSESTLRIFDRAWEPGDFSNDPDGAKQFKGTILHELIHATQYRSEQNSGVINPYENTLVQNYNDATREITDINAPGFKSWNGWDWGNKTGESPPPKWHYTNATHQPPTNYGLTNPLEDMSESVMMYVYDPQKLQTTSMVRYNFIRDFIFEGVEYDNGTQK